MKLKLTYTSERREQDALLLTPAPSTAQRLNKYVTSSLLLFKLVQMSLYMVEWSKEWTGGRKNNKQTYWKLNIPCSLGGIWVLVLALRGEGCSSCSHINNHFIITEHKLLTLHSDCKVRLYHSYTYTCFHRQGLSIMEVSEDQSNGCQSFPQSHVICQYSPANPLRYFFGRETCEAVVVQLTSLLPEGWESRFVFSSTHPGQRLLLVRQEESTHRLQKQRGVCI